MKKAKTNLKAGDLVYLKDVGYPYNRTDDGGETWEGASGIVLDTKAGYNKDMIDVEILLPVESRRGEFMKTCLFYTNVVKKENRPWLKKNLRKICDYRKKLIRLADEIQETIK
jgi:hypothetical protein